MLFTIGYGNSDLAGLLERCQKFGIDHLVDVRTNPYSRYQVDFRQPDFSRNLKKNGFKYTFLGDTIGGKPDWPEVLVAGKVEGELLAKDHRFQKGLDVLQRQIESGAVGIALLCGCGDPASCHRGRWIGRELLLRGIECSHVLTDGTQISQSTIQSKMTDQSSLFG